jgi:hypothetical protein
MPSRFASATYAACILGGTTLADDRGLIEIRGRIFLDDGMINGTVLIVETKPIVYHSTFPPTGTSPYRSPSTAKPPSVSKRMAT